MWTVKKFTKMAEMGMKTSLAYVGGFWATVFVNILQIIVFFYIWKTIYGGHQTLKGVRFDEMITYVILTRVLFTAVSFGVNNWMGYQIRSGAIIMELLRPVSYQFNLYAGRLGDLVMFFILNGLPVFLVSHVIFGMNLPKGMSNGIVFVVSIFFAITISFLFEFIIGLFSFYTANAWGLQVLKEAVTNFLSGAIVPLMFFPNFMLKIVNVLPFKDMVYTPISIYLGFVQGSEMYIALGFQLMWILILFIISKVFYNISIKKISVHGG